MLTLNAFDTKSADSNSYSSNQSEPKSPIIHPERYSEKKSNI